MSDNEYPVTKRGDQLQKGDQLTSELVIISNTWRETNLNDEELASFVEEVKQRTGAEVTDDDLAGGIMRAEFITPTSVGVLTFAAVAEFEVLASKKEELEEGEANEHTTIAAQLMTTLRSHGRGDARVTLPSLDGSGVDIVAVKTELGEKAYVSYTSASGEDAGGHDLTDEVVKLLESASQLRQHLLEAAQGQAGLDESLISATTGQRPS